MAARKIPSSDTFSFSQFTTDLQKKNSAYPIDKPHLITTGHVMYVIHDRYECGTKFNYGGT